MVAKLWYDKTPEEMRRDMLLMLWGMKNKKVKYVRKKGIK